ncbi:MAG: hypothetical protein GX601_15295 [Anaerolineales bacterium]|nr:hypothetical protein [Anaerolineales bacterium]
MPQSLPVSPNHIALVDDADYDRAARYAWFLSEDGEVAGFVPHEGRFQLVTLADFILQPGPEERAERLQTVDRLDYRRQNLRLGTPRSGSAQALTSTVLTAALKGVSWHRRKRKWQARIQQSGVRVHLGYFDSPYEAALVYDEAARIVFGPSADLNYPLERTPRSRAVVVAQKLNRHGLPL